MRNKYTALQISAGPDALSELLVSCKSWWLIIGFENSLYSHWRRLAKWTSRVQEALGHLAWLFILFDIRLNFELAGAQRG